MTILEITFNEATNGILLVQERADLDDLKTNNETLRGEKRALQNTIAETNTETEAYQDTVEAKQRLVEEANAALRNAIASAQPLIAKLQGLVDKMNATTVKITRLSLEMNAIPAILVAIEEREAKLRKQIRSVLTRINGEIRNNQVIGSVPDSGYK